jgi:hypothetical protein
VNLQTSPSRSRLPVCALPTTATLVFSFSISVDPVAFNRSGDATDFQSVISGGVRGYKARLQRGPNLRMIVKVSFSRPGSMKFNCPLVILKH